MNDLERADPVVVALATGKLATATIMASSCEETNVTWVLMT
jgi:hypothetical protein